MPIWRATIDSVKAERSKDVPQGMTVEVKPALLKAEVEKAGNSKLVKVDYRLLASYEPKVGMIEIGGSLYFIGVDADKVLKDGKITDIEMIRQAYQRIFLEPTVVAISLAKELMLPLPVKMPEVRVEEAPIEGKKEKGKKK
jgi:hypothetical protein